MQVQAKEHHNTWVKTRKNKSNVYLEALVAYLSVNTSLMSKRENVADK